MYILNQAGKVDDTTVERVKNYLKESRVSIPKERVPPSIGKSKNASTKYFCVFWSFY